MAELSHVVQIGNPMVAPEIGSPPADVNLISMETGKGIPLSQLRRQSSLPLVIIASSLS